MITKIMDEFELLSVVRLQVCGLYSGERAGVCRHVIADPFAIPIINGLPAHSFAVTHIP
jgi:hypothetical protein